MAFFKIFDYFTENEQQQLNSDSENFDDSSMAVYDHYPGNRSQYPKGSPSEYPFVKKLTFQDYVDGEVIAKSSAKDPIGDIIVTSGTLMCQYRLGVKEGFASTYNFRLLLNPIEKQSMKRIGWTDSKTEMIATVTKWHNNAPNWAGLHIFARYQTEDDLYVASFRKDGYVTIKKKVGGKYTTIKSSRVVGALLLSVEYAIAFEVDGNTLILSINGEPVLIGTDNDLTWGTAGIRSDYADTYLDFVKVTGE